MRTITLQIILAAVVVIVAGCVSQPRKPHTSIEMSPCSLVTPADLGVQKFSIRARVTPETALVITRVSTTSAGQMIQQVIEFDSSTNEMTDSVLIYDPGSAIFSKTGSGSYGVIGPDDSKIEFHAYGECSIDKTQRPVDGESGIDHLLTMTVRDNGPLDPEHPRANKRSGDVESVSFFAQTESLQTLRQRYNGYISNKPMLRFTCWVPLTKPPTPIEEFLKRNSL